MDMWLPTPPDCTDSLIHRGRRLTIYGGHCRYSFSPIGIPNNCRRRYCSTTEWNFKRTQGYTNLARSPQTSFIAHRVLLCLGTPQSREDVGGWVVAIGDGDGEEVRSQPTASRSVV